MRQPLASLVEAMPQYGGPTMSPETPHVAIVLDVSEEPGYIWPDIDQSGGGSQGPIRLVTAPGAMGKSAAAKAIASRLHAPYVDLSRMQVGTSTLTGELTKVLGWKQAPAFVAELKAGRASLVIDSTDEAQLAAGRDNYVAFLGDLAWLMADASSAGQVVLLGRRDSIDTTYLALLDLGFDAPISEIAPLSYSAACELIDRSLDLRPDGRDEYRVHRTHEAPFGELRDAVMSEIARALDQEADGVDAWSRVDRFLGYPPVVLALAERLAVDNPSAELAAGAARGITVQRRRQGALLQKVVEDILDRESVKVRQRLGDTLGMNEVQRSVLYTRDEQVARLLSHTGPAPLTVDVPAMLMPNERALYEEHIESFLLDHPFLLGKSFANVVFSDYARAWASSSPLQGLYVGTRDQFLASLPKVGPFFVHFAHSLNCNDADLGTVAEDLVDDVLHSFSLGTRNGNAVYAHGQSGASLFLVGDWKSVDFENELVFTVDQLSGVLQLTSPISRLVCVTGHGLVLTGVNGNLDIGPGVALVADQLDIRAESVVANSGSNDVAAEGVTISAGSVTHSADLKVSAYPENSLVVTWPDVWHQWKPWWVELPTRRVRLSRAVSAQILLGLRRILTAFGSSVRDDPSVLGDKIERFAIGGNRVFRAVFNALLGLGVVSKSGPLYRLHLHTLGSYEVSWAAMRDDPGRALARLHLAVAESGALDELRE